MAKVMQLVDPKMMQQIQAPVNPMHRSLHTLDQEMQSILNQHHLSDEEKVEQYNQVLQRYLEYHNHLRTPVPPPSKEAQLPNLQNKVMNTVPTVMKRKAEALLERIQHHPNASWNDRGEFVYNKKVITGSNIVDLINDMVRHRKSFEPVGWQSFAEALRESNVPQEMVGNRERWEWMHRPPSPPRKKDSPSTPQTLISFKTPRTDSLPPRSRRTIKAPLKWET